MSEVFCEASRRDAQPRRLRSRTQRQKAMLANMNIGKRMGLAFSILVVLALSVAVAGYWGLSNVAATAEHILDVDVVAADTSGQVQAMTLELRRFEKDYLLNIADPVLRTEYLNKWKTSHQS